MNHTPFRAEAVNKIENCQSLIELGTLITGAIPGMPIRIKDLQMEFITATPRALQQ